MSHRPSLSTSRLVVITAILVATVSLLAGCSNVNGPSSIGSTDPTATAVYVPIPTATPLPTATSLPTATPTKITYHLNTVLNRNCSWGTGQPATCQFRITNQATSDVTFTWQGASVPAGATFSPPSGVVAPGQVSDVITATDPFICPLTFQFIDSTHGFKVESLFNDPCK